jgi:hypothetical protein
MMMEMARTHNSMAVKRGYLIFIIIIMIFLMHHDRNFISTSASTVTVTVWSVALMYRGEPQCGGYPNLLDHYYWMQMRLRSTVLR